MLRTLSALLLLVVGCSTYRPKVRAIDEEYAPYANEGKASVTGQAFITAQGGEKKYGAAHTVYMVPVTSRSTEAFERGIVRNRPVEPEAEQSSEMVKKCKRTVQADADGKFRFEKLPPGNYYVYCQIAYKVAHSYAADRNPTPVERTEVAYSKVTLAEGEEKSITVTR